MIGLSFARATRRALGLALLVAVAGASVTSCAFATPSNAMPPCEPNSAVACTVIDGFPVGRLARDCGPDGAACGEVALLARLALDAREPNHPAPISIQLFEPDMARVCGDVLCVYSSQQSIVVFTFADGVHKATGYQCQGVGPCFGTLTWFGWANAIEQPSP